MIPVSLYIKNFLSYGENVPPLDFTEFDVACLSGDNGHGKSAILDSMTWALWGEARKAIGEKSPADGLLRIGTTEMQVELVFDLEGDRYRVLRKYHRKKNRLNKFTKTYSYEYRSLDVELVECFLDMQETWCQIKKCEENPSLLMEDYAIRQTLPYFEELDLQGGAILIDGKVEAFTLGEPLACTGTKDSADGYGQTRQMPRPSVGGTA